MNLFLTIKQHTSINSLCFLQDGRLVSSYENGPILIYNKDNYDIDIAIKDDFNDIVVCGLKDNKLASTGNNCIKIWSIDENKYMNLHILNTQSFCLGYLIEFEDGKLCSCSTDTINIWDNTHDYQCVKTLKDNNEISRVIETKNYFLSVCRDSDNYVIIWNKSTYEPVHKMENIYCWKGIAKLDDNTIIIGGYNELYIIDVSSFKLKNFKDDSIRAIHSICILKNGKILLGNSFGAILCFDYSSNEISSLNIISSRGIGFLIESKDDKLITGSYKGTIKIFTL